MHDLKDLSYIRQTFDEVLRLHPIVWTMSRDALHDDRILRDNKTYVYVPKGNSCDKRIYAVHHREVIGKIPRSLILSGLRQRLLVIAHPLPTFLFWWVAPDSVLVFVLRRSKAYLRLPCSHSAFGSSLYQDKIFMPFPILPCVQMGLCFSESRNEARHHKQPTKFYQSNHQVNVHSHMLPPNEVKQSVQKYKTIPHISEAMASIRRDGAIVISGLLPGSEISELKREVFPHFEQTQFCEGAFLAIKQKRVHSLMAKSGMCRKLAMQIFVYSGNHERSTWAIL